ncbi:MAG: long-chain acyl-CoA synthetase [Myxococcota bacterium]|jgi:long-chain acyl-CoA synthetase
MNLGFWGAAAENPDRVALIEVGGRTRTAGQLLAQANRLVHGLRGMGLGRKSAVACVVGNQLETIELFMAIAQAGMYLVPINWHLAAPEIAYILEDSQAEILVCGPEFADRCRQACDEAGLAADKVFCTGDVEGFRAYSELTDGQPDTLPDDRLAGSPMHYTSGTTGKPKGVRRPSMDLPPEAVSTGYAQFMMLFGVRPGGDAVHLTVAPTYHTAVMNFTTSSLHLGHTVVLMPTWESETVLQAIQEHRVTWSHMVPTHFVRLLALSDEVRDKYDMSSWQQVIHSAAPCPVDIKHAMLQWWGNVIYEYYAATEGGGTLIDGAQWLKKPGSVGKAWPGSEIEVRDDDLKAVAPGEVGTVYMAMGQHKFEYHGDEAKTDDAWSGRFFTVGDAGYLDEDGYLFLVDRKVDMIISGGVNIYPAEVESALIMHPQVADVAVFGIPHDDFGEQVKAVVQLPPGVQASDALGAEILTWSRTRIAGYKVPRSLDFTEELPRDPNGKLYKRKLRDPYWEGRTRAI